MPWLIAVIGPSKSGKTVLSRRCVNELEKVARISLSELRYMIFNGKRVDEDLIVSLAKGSAQVLLEVGYNVIFDIDPEDLVYLNEILEIGKNRALVVLRARRGTLMGRGASRDQVESWVWEEPKVEVDYVLELESESESDLSDMVELIGDLISQQPT